MSRLSMLRRSLIKKYAGSSDLFTKVFASLMLLSFLMIFFLGILMNGVLARNHRLQTAKTNLNMLDQAAGSMDLTMEVMSQSMRQMFWSKDFMLYMVNPDKVEQDQRYRMVQQMQSAVTGSELVKRIIFYAPFSGTVYDSNSIITEAEKYDLWPVIDTFSEDRQDLMGKHNPVRSVLYADGERLFIVGDLRIPNYLGLFLFELDPVYTARSMGLVDGEGSGIIYAYGEDGDPIFDGVYDYSVFDPADFPADMQVSNGNVNAAEDLTTGCYLAKDSVTGWSYMSPMNPKALSIRLRDFLPLYLPLSLLFILLSSLFAWQISKAVYRPIDRLMKLAAASGSRRRESSDREVDYLTSVFRHAMDEQGQMRDLLNDIAPDILDSMLECITSGKTLTEQRVTEILEGIGNPISVKGSFLVMACEIVPAQGRAVSDTELNLYMLSLHNFAQSVRTRDMDLYPVRVDRLRLSLLFCFPEGHPESELRERVGEILTRIRSEVVEPLPLDLDMEMSDPVDSLMSVRGAYREAADKLHYLQYMEADGNFAEGDISESVPDHSGEAEFDRSLYQARLAEMIEHAAQGNMEAVDSTGREIIRQIGEEGCFGEEYIRRIRSILDDLTQRTISFPLSGEDQQTIDSYNNMTERLRQMEQLRDMEPYIMEYIRVTTRMIRFYSSKSRFRYIEQAKEFISENYSNSDLSLNMVGDRIGITGAYLSELFIEITGEKFSGYMASFRVDKARQLLRSTNMPIKEIGYLCGFNSVQNFIRVFKKVAGVTPGQYREGE